MRTAATRFLIAAILFAAGAAAWGQAGLTRRVADAHERLATLHYDAADGIDDTTGPLDRLTLPIGSLDSEIRQHRSRVGYWRNRSEAVSPNGPSTGGPAAPLPGARGANVTENGAATDPELMFVSTNTAFRAATRDTTNRPATVERLDSVLQAYAEVLRADPAHADAAYNYEYVVRVRDTVARGRAPARGRRALDDELGASIDLPPGSTIHGRPGGPPPEIPGDQFRTIAPMPYEEREETDPGQGPKPIRRG
jgi:hypothetical protein